MKKDSKKNYWLTPPKHYKVLDDEFHFDFDPCPFPKPDDFDGLSAEWGQRNYVNPPFKKEDGGGIAYWITKGIEENKKGKTVVFLIHVDRCIMKLIQAGAEIRTLGETAWISTQDGSEGYSHPSAVFILREKSKAWWEENKSEGVCFHGPYLDGSPKGCPACRQKTSAEIVED